MPLSRQPSRNVRGDERRNGPAEQPVLRLDNRHAAPARGECRGDFQSDESAAQHDHVGGARRVVADGARVGDRAQRKDARELSPPASGSRRGCDPVARISRSKASRLPSVNSSVRAALSMRRGALAKTQCDVRAGIERLGAQHLRLRLRVLQKGLRQRRLVIGQFVFVADQGHRSGKSLLAQAGGRLHARMSRANDDNAAAHDSSHPFLHEAPPRLAEPPAPHLPPPFLELPDCCRPDEGTDAGLTIE